MKIIVDDLPRMPKECLFGWKHLEYSKWRCRFGGECELSAECRQCSHLVSFATDINVATKDGTDCISRQAAIDALRDYLVGKRCPDDGTLTCRLIENEVINKLPPIQPKRGQWIDDGSELGCQCSQCGKTLDEYINCGTEYMTLTEIPKFCPNCGADMREMTT